MMELFLSIYQLIFRNRKLVVGINSVVILVTIIYLLLITPWFRSSSKILISANSKSDLMGALSSAIPFNIGGLNSDVEAERFIGYLRSRKIQGPIIEKYNLQKVYEKTTIDDTYLELNGNLFVFNNDDGTLTIVFDYKGDPQLAAQINQSFIDGLSSLVLDLENQSTRNHRQFLEKSYLEIRSITEAFEDSLVNFQKETKVFEPETQLKKSIEAYADLEAEKIKLFIEKEVIEAKLFSSGRVDEIESQIKVLSSVLKNRLSGNQTDDASLSVISIVDNSKDFYRLFRTITVNVKVMEFMRLQLEQARLDENKSYSGIQIIDTPNVPQKKVRPKRGATVINVGLLTFFASIVLVKLTESFDDFRKRIKHQ